MEGAFKVGWIMRFRKQHHTYTQSIYKATQLPPPLSLSSHSLSLNLPTSQLLTPIVFIIYTPHLLSTTITTTPTITTIPPPPTPQSLPTMSDWRPHEHHHSGPPPRDYDEPRDRDGGRSDFYSHEGNRRSSRSRSRSRSRSGNREKKGEDHEVLGTLAGGVAGALGGHALGGKSGHGVAGTIIGAVAGAFAGHEVEEKVDEWKDKRDDKKRYEQEQQQQHHHHNNNNYNDGPPQGHYGGGGGGHPPPRDDYRPGGGEFRGGGGGGGGETEVTVQPGDTLRGIAARFDGASWEEIARHNNIANPDMIYPGQVLRIPRRY